MGTNSHKKNVITYEIMHMEKVVACISTNGKAVVYLEAFMPYDLYLENEDRDIDILVNNLNDFYHWCASRVLSLDRKYANALTSHR